MDIEDLQATVTAGSCSSRIIFNVPKAHSAGLELELGGRADRQLRFLDLGRLQRLRARLDLRSRPAATSGIQEGNRLPTVPEFQAALAGTYSVDDDE